MIEVYYLTWLSGTCTSKRPAARERGNISCEFTRTMDSNKGLLVCQVCTASIKDNKGLRLEVHHAKTFDDRSVQENNITSMKQACKEIWSLDNGISLCYCCHKNMEKLRTKIRNMFVVERIDSEKR